MQLNILETLQKPRYSTILKEMRVEFGPCPIGSPSKDCLCREVDHMVGLALGIMEVLEILSIKCRLCQDPSNPRHRYLMDLPTRSLREFCYDCHCTEEGMTEPTPFILAPWMASLTALNWASSFLTPALDEKLRELIQDATFLENIDTMQYYSMASCEDLLAKRAIRRVSCSSQRANLLAAMSRSPNKHLITHLSIRPKHLSELLNGSELNQFRSLQHIGTLSFCSHDSDSSVTTVGIRECF